MPVAFLELPSGLGMDTKKKLVKDVADAIHDAYQIPIRAYSSANGRPIRQALTVSSADRFGPSATSSFRPGVPSTRNESWSSG